MVVGQNPAGGRGRGGNERPVASGPGQVCRRTSAPPDGQSSATGQIGADHVQSTSPTSAASSSHFTGSLSTAAESVARPGTASAANTQDSEPAADTSHLPATGAAQSSAGGQGR